jgi:glycine reductase complex component B subunit gamma
MDRPVKVVHYLNQFFGGLGGEEQAYAPVQVKDGAVGPGRALQASLKDQGSVVATIVAGDNYFTEELEPAKAAVKEILDRLAPDLVLAGPAFDAGRYGLACAEVCRLAQAQGTTAITGMHPENPGILTYRRDVWAVPTGANSAEMAQALEKMLRLAFKRLHGEALGPAQAEGYIPHGVRQQVTHDMLGYERAVSMLTARLAGRPFVSEMLMTGYDSVPPAPPINDLKTAVIGLVSSGGLVPRGNRDRLVGARAEQFFRYSIEGLEALTVEEWESVHGGFSTVILNNKNPNYAMPLSLVRALEAEGVIKAIYPSFFSTTGNGTAVASAKRMGAEIAGELRTHRVDGVLLVAT